MTGDLFEMLSYLAGGGLVARGCITGGVSSIFLGTKKGTKSSKSKWCCNDGHGDERRSPGVGAKDAGNLLN